MDEPRTLAGRLYDLYTDAESHVSGAAESLVGSDYFAKLFATSVSNAMAIARVAHRGLDRGVHASRIAGRADVMNIGRQLARTEDKLEQLLQLVEAQQARLDAVQVSLDKVATPTARLHTAAPSAQRAVPAAPNRAASGTRPVRAKPLSAPSRRRTP